MNRLRAPFADQQAKKEKARLQSEIVRDYRDEIVELIADDFATLNEVVSSVRALGEPVLDAGFKAEILKQIGTVKNIRTGRTSPAALVRDPPRMRPSPAIVSTSLPVSQTGNGDILDDDDDELFVARKPRG